MTTTKLAYVLAMIVPGGLAMLALALVLKLYFDRPQAAGGAAR